jgi:small-conductance mechanosensitive channel
MTFGGILVPAEVMVRVLGVIAAYLAFTVCQRFWRRSPLLHNLALQLNLLVLVLLVLLLLSPVLARWHAYVLDGCAAFAAFLGLAIGAKLLDVFWFDLVARWRKKRQVPVVVRDIGRLAITLVAGVMIVRAFFPGVNLNVLALSSLVVGYIVGNATQDTLGNLVAGLALNTEQPFHIGDWVTVGGHTGIVVDTTWRATRLKTRAEDYVVIPNSAIAREPIINFSHPTRHHGCYVTIGVDYETPPNRARATILGVLESIPEVCREPAPLVFLSAYGDSSINFSIKFFIADYAALEVVQSLVLDRLWYALRRDGISIPFPIRDVRMRDTAGQERRREEIDRECVHHLLRGVDLFQSLAAADLDRLAAAARSELFAAGEAVFREGDEGDTFYVVRSGRMAVTKAGAAGEKVVLARLETGAFFGEMSLLTGAKRSATVAAEIDTAVLAIAKPVFAAVLQADATLADKLADVLEQRLAAQQARVATASPTAPEPPPPHAVIVMRIRQFFGLT